MTYKIALLCDSDPYADCIKYLLAEIGNKLNAVFDIEVYQTADGGISNDTLIKLKQASAIIFGVMASDDDIAIYEKVAKHLDLHSRISYISALCTDISPTQKDFYLVTNAFGGIYDGDKGFRYNDKFGREAYDTECYSELEIEKVVRTAYEIADVDGASDPLHANNEPTMRRKLTLFDMADRLTTSKLWRKIVADVNEDYPQIYVEATTLQEGIASILDVFSYPENYTHDVMLAPKIFADIILPVAEQAYNCDLSAIPVAYFGDTPLGAYGVLDTANPFGTFIGTVQSVAIMLKHSFNMGNIADKIMQALYKNLDDCPTDETLLEAVLKNI